MRLLSFPIALLISLGICRPSDLSITVDTPRGRVIGFHASFSPNLLSNYASSGNVFLGIPFAQPPRRFKRPQPLFSYDRDPLIAKELGPACTQTSHSDLEMSENCLYLNVVTPSIRSPQLYPVMVFIHGGSFSAGTARQYDHEGLIRNLVRHGVIVVTIQYRLGALGFFNTGSEDFPSNLGLLDQIESLRWVQSEIVSFGGDPNRVTLFGNSAGAASISAHTYSPLSRGLFHSVILESGSILTCLDGALGSTDPSRLFALTVCNFTSSDWEEGNFTRLHDCLENIDAKRLTDFDRTSLTGWKMVQDPYFLPSTPSKLAPFRHNIPVLVGTMRDEFEYFLGILQPSLPNGPDLFSQVVSQIIQDPKQFRDLNPYILSAYGNASSNDQSNRRTTSDALTCGAFVAPIQREIREWMRYGNNDIFIYEMTYPSRVLGLKPIGDWDPAVHTGELPFVTGSSFYWKKAVDNNWTTPFEFHLMDWMGEAWTNFASTGIPDPSWSPVSPYSTKLPYLEISSTGLRMKEDYRSSDEFFWNVEVPKIVGDLPTEKIFVFETPNGELTA